MYKSGLRIFVRALKVPFSGTQKLSLLADKLSLLENKLVLYLIMNFQLRKGWRLRSGKQSVYLAMPWVVPNLPELKR